MEINPLDLDLYCLSDLLDGKRLGEIVWVVESEADADCLRSVGLLSTTGPRARGWLLDLGKVLHGRRVVVIHRADEYGRQWAADVVASLVYWNSLRIALIQAEISIEDYVRGNPGKEQAIAGLMEELKSAPRWERVK